MSALDFSVHTIKLIIFKILEALPLKVISFGFFSSFFLFGKQFTRNGWFFSERSVVDILFPYGCRFRQPPHPPFTPNFFFIVIYVFVMSFVANFVFMCSNNCMKMQHFFGKREWIVFQRLHNSFANQNNTKFCLIIKTE